MADWALNLWQTFYVWASSQPFFIQVAVGIALVIVGGYLVLVVLSLLFSFLADR